MSFVPEYAQTTVQTPTTPGKQLQVKSWKIDLSRGDSWVTGSPITLGFLPKDAQPVGGTIVCPVPVSGGTVSAAGVSVSINGSLYWSAANVFGTQAGLVPNSTQYYANQIGTVTTDQKVTYTPTLTGAGPTAGVLYITVFYVV